LYGTHLSFYEFRARDEPSDMKATRPASASASASARKPSTSSPSMSAGPRRPSTAGPRRAARRSAPPAPLSFSLPEMPPRPAGGLSEASSRATSPRATRRATDASTHAEIVAALEALEPATFARPPLAATELERLREEFDALRDGGSDRLRGDQVVAVLLAAGLEKATLKKIWALADWDEDGQMTLDEFVVAMYLVDGARRGAEPPASLADLPAGTFPFPFPFPFPAASASASATPTRARRRARDDPDPRVDSPAAHDPSNPWPRITRGDLNRHRSVFDELNDDDDDDYLSGEAVVDLLLSAGLSNDVCKKIWDLADADGDGDMTWKEFVVAMYLTERASVGQDPPNALSDLPAGTFDAEEVEEREESVTRPSFTSSRSSGTAKLPRASRVNADAEAVPVPLESPVRPPPEPTPTLAPEDPRWPRLTEKDLAKHRTTFEEMKASDGAREMEMVDGGAMAELLATAGLEQATLETIWDLADADGDGHMTWNEFVVAMYLTERATAGQPPPASMDEIPPDAFDPELRVAVAPPPVEPVESVAPPSPPPKDPSPAPSVMSPSEREFVTRYDPKAVDVADVDVVDDDDDDARRSTPPRLGAVMVVTRKKNGVVNVVGPVVGPAAVAREKVASSPKSPTIPTTRGWPYRVRPPVGDAILSLEIGIHASSARPGKTTATLVFREGEVAREVAATFCDTHRLPKGTERDVTALLLEALRRHVDASRYEETIEGYWRPPGHKLTRRSSVTKKPPKSPYDP